MTGQCVNGLLNQIQIGTYSAFCTSSALPITVNTMAQTLAYVLTFALSLSSFGANSHGLRKLAPTNRQMQVSLCAGGLTESVNQPLWCVHSSQI